MSNINTNGIRLYGGMPSGDIQVQQGAGPSNAGVSETLVVGTYRRSVAGPKINSRFSIQMFVDSAAGAASVASIWYSNHPNPSVASDADWTQDLTVGSSGSIDLTVTGSKLFLIKDTDVEFVMVKAIIAVTSGNIRVFYRAEGTTHAVPG